MQFIDVVDIPVVAQRQILVWVFTAVNTQRQVLAVLSEHSAQKTVDFPQVQCFSAAYAATSGMSPRSLTAVSCRGLGGGVAGS